MITCLSLGVMILPFSCLIMLWAVNHFRNVEDCLPKLAFAPHNALKVSVPHCLLSFLSLWVNQITSAQIAQARGKERGNGMDKQEGLGDRFTLGFRARILGLFLPPPQEHETAIDSVGTSEASSSRWSGNWWMASYLRHKYKVKRKGKGTNCSYQCGQVEGSFFARRPVGLEYSQK